MPSPRVQPGPGQESVWDYPRPPALVPSSERVRVEHRGTTIADTTRSVRVLETSQPPAYYLPPEDVRTDLLVPSPTRTLCEWKGLAEYWDLQLPEGTLVPEVAWSYPQPTARFADLAGYLAFYAQRVEGCWVDGERVVANDGGFYGGWITSRVVGPFKGAPGTAHW